MMNSRKARNWLILAILATTVVLFFAMTMVRFSP